jgi:hypothetical protein
MFPHLGSSGQPGYSPLWRYPPMRPAMVLPSPNGGWTYLQCFHCGGQGHKWRFCRALFPYYQQQRRRFVPRSDGFQRAVSRPRVEAETPYERTSSPPPTRMGYMASVVTIPTMAPATAEKTSQTGTLLNVANNTCESGMIGVRVSTRFSLK